MEHFTLAKTVFVYETNKKSKLTKNVRKPDYQKSSFQTFTVNCLILDPANNEVVTKVPKSTQQEMERAVEAAKAAFPVKN